jgi:tetratricopeptide (TPR) repeat protein
MPRLAFLPAVLILAAAIAPAQSPAPAPNTLMLVTPSGPGTIPLPNGPDWKPQALALYDNNARPAAQLKNGEVIVSYILFQRTGGEPTAKGCLDDVINPITQNPAVKISQRKDGELPSPSGQTLATTTYLLDMDPGHKLDPRPNAPGYYQRNSFAFAANAQTCAEIHLSSIHETRDALGALNTIQAAFEPNLTYQPIASDYFRLANQFFKAAPASAAPYYKSALAALPNTPATLTPRRVITDQLVISLGRAGDLKTSRAMAEQAAAQDPDYPLNYYNLACADAEEGNAAAARTHLQQAFDRRANTLKGEHLPDPTKDDSIVKLKKDKPFWTFVESLPKS